MLEQVRGDEAARLFLEHIGVGKSARSLDFLRELAVHFSRLPYENISKIIKTSGLENRAEALRLPREVVVDHIERGFGGTCFSLTFFLERVLKNLGFDAYKVMADMNSGRNVHCLVVVREAGAQYVIDPGYALYEVIGLPGGHGPPGGDGPVERQGASHHTQRVVCPHAEVELVRGEDGAYNLWTDDATGRKWRYVFRNQPVPEKAFEGFWIESFGKPTLNNICLNRITPRGHIYLRKDFFKFSSRETITKRRLKADIERLVAEEFGIAGEWTEMAQNILVGRRRSKRST